MQPEKVDTLRRMDRQLEFDVIWISEVRLNGVRGKMEEQLGYLIKSDTARIGPHGFDDNQKKWSK